METPWDRAGKKRKAGDEISEDSIVKSGVIRKFRDVHPKIGRRVLALDR
jgi:hypothetical protein